MQNFNIIDSSRQAALLLKQGVTLRMTSSYTLFKMNEAKQVLVWNPNFTTRLSQTDFLELYGSCSFVIVESEQGIDEKKDDAYYAWRHEHQ